MDLLGAVNLWMLSLADWPAVCGFRPLVVPFGTAEEAIVVESVMYYYLGRW